MKIKNREVHKTSLQTKLIRLFLVTSVIPILILSFSYYYNTSNILKKNTEELTIDNLEQTGNSLKIWLESYEDILYQIYTDDDVASQVDKLNTEEDLAVTVKQLRRFIQGLLNTKNYIRSITIITSNGLSITYDQLTSVTNRNSWIGNFTSTGNELYEEVSKDNKIHIFPTEYGASFANEDYYMFHIAHRIIDYKDLEKRSGIVVISIDENLLRDVCLNQNEMEEGLNSFNFLVDQNGRIISYINKEPLTLKVTDPEAELEKRKNDYLEFIVKENLFEKKYISVSVYREDGLSWDIVNVSNHKEAMSILITQQEIVLLVSLASLIIVIILTLVLSNSLVKSVKNVVSTMRVASLGNMETKIEVERTMPLEVETIAIQFNDMLGKLDEMMKKEKEIREQQHVAEIKALEAQINPHFLYNTLDTINWMAIDKCEFDISNAITSLATILRYAIKNSNGMVEIREEVEWLKKYIYLQQTRLKNTFQCEINIEPDVMDCKIHKLLLQPFVENAIIHGFEGMKKEHILKVQMWLEGGSVCISIEDNGKGIENSVIEKFSNKSLEKPDSSEHIGIENAISRLYMYYGEQAKVRINSILGEGTEIKILIPQEGKTHEDCGC